MIGSWVTSGEFPSKYSKCCFHRCIRSCWLVAFSIAFTVFFLLTSFIICYAILDCLSSLSLLFDHTHICIHTHTHTHIYIYIWWLSIGSDDDVCVLHHVNERGGGSAVPTKRYIVLNSGTLEVSCDHCRGCFAVSLFGSSEFLASSLFEVGSSFVNQALPFWSVHGISSRSLGLMWHHWRLALT